MVDALGGRAEVAVLSDKNAATAVHRQIQASASQLASGNVTFDGSDLRTAMVIIDVTVLTGTSPTTQYFVEVYDPISTKWVPIANTAALTAATTVCVFLDESSATLPSVTGFTFVQGRPLSGNLPSAASQHRIRWVLGGTITGHTFSASILGKVV